MRMLARVFSLIAFFSLSAFFVLPAHGLVRKVPFEEMPGMADFIIVGQVVDVSTRLGERGIMVWTDYTIVVEEKVKGPGAAAEVVMSFAGGSAEGKSIHVSDVPRLEVGDTYILLGHDNANKYASSVIGGAQGLFRRVYDAATGSDFVVDYNWRRMELADDGEMVRGAHVRFDKSGALVVIKPKPRKKPEHKSVVRDYKGRPIPQPPRDSPVYAKPKPRKRGQPVSVREFTDALRGILRGGASQGGGR